MRYEICHLAPRNQSVVLFGHISISFQFLFDPPALLVKVTADESVTVIAVPTHLVNRPMKFQFNVTDTMMMIIIIIIRFFLL